MIKKIITSTICLLLLANSNFAFAEEAKKIDKETYPKLSATLEYGFLAVLDHKIQFSENNTYFDYRKDGGQNNLFNVGKYSLDLDFNENNKFVFLYQPLSLVTQNNLPIDIKEDNIDFPKGTPMKFTYDFPFFRASYLYDFDKDKFDELALGLSLQLRNANIEFESLDGKKLVSRKNVGPVPIIKFRYKKKFHEKLWAGTDIDGFYAPKSYLNGSNNTVIGAILDANVSLGTNISEKYFPYLNLRYIGGGGVGKSNDKQVFGDSYSNNWLNFFTFTLGMNTQIF